VLCRRCQLEQALGFESFRTVREALDAAGWDPVMSAAALRATPAGPGLGGEGNHARACDDRAQPERLDGPRRVLEPEVVNGDHEAQDHGRQAKKRSEKAHRGRSLPLEHGRRR